MRTARRLLAFPYGYYFLALGVLVAAVATATILSGRWSAFERKTFDLVMQSRLRVPAPQADMVLVDIDEHSLSALADDYGRWPWPRRVLAEFIDAVEAQQPRAIILDVLFADPDLHNPDSELAFDAAVRRAPHVYYAAVRLPPQFDAASKLSVDRVPGAIAPTAPAVAASAPPVAMLLPYLESILATQRIGTINLLPDRDGVAREALLFHNVGGWRIPSLPALVATRLGTRLPADDSVVLNWRGPAGAYPHLSFSDIYLDTLRQKPLRPGGEFRDKIVFVGSSASGLFDLRPTPVSAMHPGTEILATALDNLMQGDYIRRAPAGWVALLTAGFVLALAWMFAAHHDDRISDRAFVVVQMLVGVLAFAVIHFAPVYIDASAPITFGTIYFALARMSLAARDSAQVALLGEKLAGGALSAHVLWLHAAPATRHAPELRRLLEAAAKRSRLAVSRLSPPADSLGLLNRVFDGEAGLVWFVAADGREDAQVKVEVDRLIRQAEAWAGRRRVNLRHSVGSAIIPQDAGAGQMSSLRQLFSPSFVSPTDVAQELAHE